MRDRTKHSADKDKPTREGDVLGISDSPLEPALPGVINRGTGHPQGIDVRRPSTGIGDVGQHPGATGIDMGGAGDGEVIEDSRISDRRRKAEE